MSNKQSKSWVSVVGRILLANALIFSQSAWAGQNQKTTSKANSPQQATAPPGGEKQSATVRAAKAQSEQAQGEAPESAVAEEKPSSDASHQGIKVHGHWTIEVRNPDGRLVTHREFENSYVPTDTFLAGVLSRSFSVGHWDLFVTGSGTVPGPCGSNAACYIVESTDFPGALSYFHTLSVGASNGTLVLSGTLVAPMTGSIYEVFSEPHGCASSVAPLNPCLSSGAQGGPFTLTQAFLSPLINVSAGQTVAVTVNISFS